MKLKGVIHLKYMGSKSKIAKYIVPIIQSYVEKDRAEVYVELFVGGANVIDKVKAEYKVGYDINPYLIALLKRVQSGKPLLEEVPFELYDKARKAFYNKTSEFKDWEIGNIGFLASYNGRFFDGGYAKSGYEKTPKGERFRDYYREAKDNLLKQAPDLKGIDFRVGDYKKSFTNCVVYLDPPYQGGKAYLYSPDFDYDEFWNYVRWLSTHNTVLVSELNAPADFKVIWEQEVSRSIKATDKGKAVEKLFKYKY